MQLKRPIGASLAAATCGLLSAAPHGAMAQSAPQNSPPKWDIETALLYWGEDNDRVKDVSVTIGARRTFDEDRTLSGTLTVDTLTGASPSGAVPSTTPQTFTRPSGNDSYVVPVGEAPLDNTFKDTRVALSLNWRQALGETMRWSAGLSASSEYDYLHLGVNSKLERDFNLKNTTAYVGAAYGKDDIDPVGGAPIGFAPMRAVGNAASKLGSDSKDVLDVLLGVTQVVSRRSLLEVAYSYSKSDGYLSDPYKVLSVVDPITGSVVPGPSGSGLGLHLYEKRPDARAKQSIFAEWRYAFDRDSFAVNYRLMDDDWGITSHTVDARYRWNIRAERYLEPHVRYYRQTAADFYRTALVNGAPLPEFASADYRLAEGNAITAGLEYGQRLGRGSLSVRLEYYRQTADASPQLAFGALSSFDLVPPLNAVIAQFTYKFKL
jgi:Protein of unknown function (DUF3570)